MFCQIILIINALLHAANCKAMFIYWTIEASLEAGRDVFVQTFSLSGYATHV
jgi:hypothetical protein